MVRVVLLHRLAGQATPQKEAGFQRKKDALAFEEEFLRTRARSCD